MYLRKNLKNTWSGLGREESCLDTLTHFSMQDVLLVNLILSKHPTPI